METRVPEEAFPVFHSQSEVPAPHGAQFHQSDPQSGARGSSELYKAGPLSVWAASISISISIMAHRSAIPDAYYAVFAFYEPLLCWLGFLGALADPKAVSMPIHM
jgi:hypothetical protein